MAESRHLLIFWEMFCFISGKSLKPKSFVSKDFGFKRGNILSVGFNIRYECLASCTDHVYFMFYK